MPAVIIAETELPGALRGWQAIQTLRHDPELAPIPVITCSWLTAAEALARGGTQAGHLQKPDLNYADFLAVLSSAGIELPAHSEG